MLPLRFVAGLAVGALGVIAFNNRKNIKDGIKSGIDKTKEVATDIKENTKATVDCIKSKKSENSKVNNNETTKIEIEDKKE